MGEGGRERERGLHALEPRFEEEGKQLDETCACLLIFVRLERTAAGRANISKCMVIGQGCRQKCRQRSLRDEDERGK